VSNSIIVTVKNNLTLTANFQRIPPPPPPPPPPPATPPVEITPSPYAAQEAKPRKTPPAVITLRIAGAAAGGIGIIGGIAVDGGLQSVYDEYRAAKNTPQAEKARENVDGKIALRNTLYTVAGVGLAGFTVTLFF
jgi:hypothetical protein